MKTLSLILIVFLPFAAFAQSDILVLKKRNKLVQSFYPGSQIYYSTALGFRDAYIKDIKKDSLFLVQYDVRTVMTNLGVYMLDTVAAYPYAISYKDITAIGKHTGGFIKNSGAALFGGGTLLTAAGLVSWVLAKPNTRYYARPELVGGAAVLAGVGFLMMKADKRSMPVGKKYSLQYISTR